VEERLQGKISIFSFIWHELLCLFCSLQNLLRSSLCIAAPLLSLSSIILKDSLRLNLSPSSYFLEEIGLARAVLGVCLSEASVVLMELALRELVLLGLAVLVRTHSFHSSPSSRCYWMEMRESEYSKELSWSREPLLCVKDGSSCSVSLN
jgi:hypothetical protein